MVKLLNFSHYPSQTPSWESSILVEVESTQISEQCTETEPLTELKWHIFGHSLLTSPAIQFTPIK